VKFEVVGFDNKGSPQESLNTLKAGDRPGLPLHHAGQRLRAPAWRSSMPVAKHNERNPGKEVIYLNYAAVDPA
jgi:branched-chain amino acid transport system substrate-binding protein